MNTIEIGAKFGRWTVLRETRKKGKRYFECLCECGTVKEIYYLSLLKGTSLSCGCFKNELWHDRAMDLTGRKFGKLTVLCPDETRNRYFICKCECGTVKSIKGTSLTKKKEPTRSCGCIQHNVAVGIGTKTAPNNFEKEYETSIRFNTNFHVIESEKLPKNNTSGHKGVWFDKSRGKWTAYINVHRKKIFLGRYTTIEDAIKARELAEGEYFAPLIEGKNEGVSL
jgi:hypothetical protein